MGGEFTDMNKEDLIMGVSTVEEMRLMDRMAIEEYGIEDVLLMENAGIASYDVFIKEFPENTRSVVVVSGTGNNGGDGFVVARKLFSMGYDVSIYICGNPERYRGAAKINHDIVKKLGLSVDVIDELGKFREAVFKSDVIIDAIFGTGLSRDVEGIYRDIIDIINKSGRYVCSIDIPSGINGNTGEIMGIAVKSRCTVTFGAPKLGNILYPGFSYCGKVYVTRISFPPSIYKNGCSVFINTPPVLPERKDWGHKGDFGDVLFISGSYNYFGAPYFCSMSFLKAGGGYARLAAPGSVIKVVAGKGSEIVMVPMEETPDGSISKVNLDKLMELSQRVDFAVVGPGLSLNEETGELVIDFIKNSKIPILIDGDGLTFISKNLEVLKERTAVTILTPHPGEMARLLGVTIGEVVKNRVNIIRDFSKQYRVITVLKGAHSLIAYPDGRVIINLSGNSSLATAGSGDVLAGTIAAMYGLGLSPEESVAAGVFIHGLAGEIATENIGADGVTAGILTEFLPFAVKNYRENYRDIVKDFHGKIFMV